MSDPRAFRELALRPPRPDKLLTFGISLLSYNCSYIVGTNLILLVFFKPLKRVKYCSQEER